MRVLIVSSGNPRGSLAGARYLSRAGWTVNAGTADTGGPFARSRATTAVYEIPPVERDLEAFLAATVDALERSDSELVLPGSDSELLALSAHRDRIPAVVPLADDAVVRRCVDKLELTRAARRVGLGAPETVAATDEALASARYPVVLKSRFHWLPEHSADAPARLEAAICEDEASAREGAAVMRRAGGDPLLQELVEGLPVYVHLVTDQDGQVLGFLQQVGPRLYYPPGAGRRVRSTVVRTDPALEGLVRTLMLELGWFGFAGLAFLRTPEGVPAVIDFNGRLPLALEVSAGAGHNYVGVWAALATGREPPPLPAPHIGRRWQNLEADLRRARRERRGGLLRDVGGTLAYAVRAQHTIAKWDDPSLVVRYSAQLVRQSGFAARMRRT